MRKNEAGKTILDILYRCLCYASSINTLVYQKSTDHSFN